MISIGKSEEQPPDAPANSIHMRAAPVGGYGVGVGMGVATLPRWLRAAPVPAPPPPDRHEHWPLRAVQVSYSFLYVRCIMV